MRIMIHVKLLPLLVGLVLGCLLIMVTAGVLSRRAGERPMSLRSGGAGVLVTVLVQLACIGAPDAGLALTMEAQ